MATVIVVGNEKGGAGKTTVAVHLTVALLYLGFKVGCCPCLTSAGLEIDYFNPNSFALFSSAVTNLL